MSDDGLTARGGHDVPWSSIKRLDETKWKTKGIAWVHYQESTGGDRRLLLDDFKMQREPIKAMVQRIQALLNPPQESTDATTDQPAESTGDTTQEEASSETTSA